MQSTSKKFKILDCTLRDGGYYTNWDFSKEITKNYFVAMEKLPVDYIEIGYRNLIDSIYRGEYYYSPISSIKLLKQYTTKPLVVILDEKKLEINQIIKLLKPCLLLVKMVRLAVDPMRLDEALKKAKEIKKMGFEVAINLMYLSKWINNDEFIKKIEKIDLEIDYLYLVDSFGGVYPDQIFNLIERLSNKKEFKIGFHGHNNLELAFSNTLSAIKAGVDIVDSTILGMGRGAGNLKTELILPYLFNKNIIDYGILSTTLKDFQSLLSKYSWGTNLPYIIAGIHNVPQKKIMDWLISSFYSLDSIVKSLTNSNSNDLNFKIFNKKNKHEKVLVIGGGPSVIENIESLKLLIDKDYILLFSSTTHFKLFNELDNQKYICIVGNEENRIDGLFKELSNENINLILPPKPREIGTFINESLNKYTYELDEFKYYKKSESSHCSVSVEMAYRLSSNKNVYLTGFDGYDLNKSNEKEKIIFFKNDKVFKMAREKGLNLSSLTPTNYTNIGLISLYSLID